MINERHSLKVHKFENYRETFLDVMKPRRQPGIKIWEKIPTLIETITKGIVYLWVHELTRGKTSSTGVPGLNDTPGCIPFDLMFWMSSCQLSVSSFSIRREKVQRINHLPTDTRLPLATSIWNVNPEAPQPFLSLPHNQMGLWP
jgi:hypothetical protein